MPAIASVRRHLASAVSSACRGTAVEISKRGRAVAAIVDISTLRLVEEAEAAVVREKVKGKLHFVEAKSIWELL